MNIDEPEMIPRADAELALALMVEKARSLCKTQAGLSKTNDYDLAWCRCAGYLEYEILTLTPASALAELQALRAERDAYKAASEAAHTDITTYLRIVADMTQEAEAAEAELTTLRAQVERLTVKPLLFSELVDGGCMGRPHPFQYFITQNHNGRFLCHWDETWHDTLPEAQAHAQKDYQIAALTEGAAP